MLCEKCKQEIHPDRLEALPETKHCISCADGAIPDQKGYMVFSHKTAPELIRISTHNKEQLRQANRANERKR